MEKTPEYYNNEHGSLYKIAEQHNLNAYEFEILKRVFRCRKKGEFMSDLEKTKNVIDLYINEVGHKFSGQYEKLNHIESTKSMLEVFTDFVQSPEPVDITTLNSGDRFLINGNAHKMISIEDSYALICCHVLDEKTNITLKLLLHKGELFVYKLISDKESTER